MKSRKYNILIPTIIALFIAPALAACDNAAPNQVGATPGATSTLEAPATSVSNPGPTPTNQGNPLLVTPGLGGGTQPVATQVVASTPTTASSLATVQAAPSAVAGASQTAKPPASTEQPVAPEQNPPGDIPDTQAFVKYVSSSGGYELDAPEGWARTENGPNVSFVDKLDGVMVSITDSPSAPTAATARNNEVAALLKSGRAVEITAVKDVQLPGGAAVLVEYTSNSEPNPVTGKQVRLENNAYLFYKSGKLATLTMWAPLGSDNVDQWQRISQSFRWR